MCCSLEFTQHLWHDSWFRKLIVLTFSCLGGIRRIRQWQWCWYIVSWQQKHWMLCSWQSGGGVGTVYLDNRNTGCCVRGSRYTILNLENITVCRLIWQCILRNKHWIQYDWPCKFNAKHGAYSCTDLCENKTMLITIRDVCIHLRTTAYFYPSQIIFLCTSTWFREWYESCPTFLSILVP